MKLKETLPSNEVLKAIIKEFNKKDYDDKIVAYNIFTGEIFVRNVMPNSNLDFHGEDGWKEIYFKREGKGSLNMWLLKTLINDVIGMWSHAF